MVRKIISLIPFVIAGITLTAPASADDQYAKFNDRFNMYLGGFIPTVDSKIAINGEVLSPSGPISLEKVLGVDDSKAVLWGGLHWRYRIVIPSSSRYSG